jgi:hypothetical protein
MLRLLLRTLVACSLLGAAVIHAAQAPSHLAEWWAAGVTFVALAAAQGILGVAACRWWDRWVWLVAQAVSVAAIGLWALSRSVGLPLGPEAGVPVPVGRADLVAVALEGATLVAATLLLLWPGPRAASQLGQSAPAAILVLVVALLGGAVSWYGLQPTSVCGGHDLAYAELGPLVPVEGHSLLPAATPIATAAVGQRVGLVVGLLRNCATTPITIQTAQLLNQDGEGHAASSGRFLITTVASARPGIALPAEQLANARPLPGQVTVAPTPEAPTQALLLELRTRGPGGFRVDAVTITYQGGGRRYSTPFATNAQLATSTTNQRPRRAEAIPYASLAALARPHPTP